MDSIYSPYYKVQLNTWYLDYYEPIELQPADSDTSYTIPIKYNEQPWRAAKDLYGNERLYYIFALLNPDLIQDPIYDFVSNLVIQVPSIDRVRTYLK